MNTETSVVAVLALAVACSGEFTAEQSDAGDSGSAAKSGTGGRGGSGGQGATGGGGGKSGNGGTGAVGGSGGSGNSGGSIGSDAAAGGTTSGGSGRRICIIGRLQLRRDGAHSEFAHGAYRLRGRSRHADVVAELSELARCGQARFESVVRRRRRSQCGRRALKHTVTGLPVKAGTFDVIDSHRAAGRSASRRSGRTRCSARKTCSAVALRAVCSM